MNWIEHIAEPKRLLLAWQAPDHMEDRFRWAVGRIEKNESAEWSFSYLRPGGEFEGLNDGRQFEDLFALGFEGYPAFSLKRREYEGDAVGVFLRRLPPSSRPDFSDYCRQFRIQPESVPSGFSLLGLTEAKLPGDGFSIVDPLDGDVSRCELMLEVAGFRYYADEAKDLLKIGATVSLVPEPDNERDANAIKLCIRGQTVGYVNRLQTRAFHQWLQEKRVDVVLERLNGKPDHPRAFLFVRVHPKSERFAA
jgi:hypothetical protein